MAPLSWLVRPSVLGIATLLVSLALGLGQGVVIVLLYWYIRFLLAKPWLEHTAVPTGGQGWLNWKAGTEPSASRRYVVSLRDYLAPLSLHCA